MLRPRRAQKGCRLKRIWDNSTTSNRPTNIDDAENACTTRQGSCIEEGRPQQGVTFFGKSLGGERRKIRERKAIFPHRSRFFKTEARKKNCIIMQIMPTLFFLTAQRASRKMMCAENDERGWLLHWCGGEAGFFALRLQCEGGLFFGPATALQTRRAQYAPTYFFLRRDGVMACGEDNKG